MTAAANWDGHQWDPAGHLAQVEPDGCEYCGDPNKPPIAVVCGSPMRDVVTIVDSDGIEVCGDCLPSAIKLALIEHDSARPAVRVVPIKAVAS